MRASKVQNRCGGPRGCMSSGENFEIQTSSMVANVSKFNGYGEMVEYLLYQSFKILPRYLYSIRPISNLNHTFRKKDTACIRHLYFYGLDTSCFTQSLEKQ